MSASPRGTFPNHLASYRNGRAMTQVQLAQRSGMGVRTLQYIEWGQHIPRASTKRKLLKALDLDWTEAAKVWPPLAES